jgi:serine/threonine protein kinase
MWLSRDEVVAVKKLRVDFMSDSVKADFYAELAFLNDLPHHAHIVALHGVCIDEAAHQYLMVMDWMENGSLFAYLKNQSPASFPLRRQLHIAMQCAKAINHLHLLPPPKGPVLHRDVKTMNFLLDSHNDVKVSVSSEH